MSTLTSQAHRLSLKENQAIYGGKLASLIFLENIHYKVPPFFFLSPDISVEYFKAENKEEFVRTNVNKVYKYIMTACAAGTIKVPLFSVRSGSINSMPGIMETFLNVGITPQNFVFLCKQLGTSTVLNCFIRLRKTWGTLISAIPENEFPEYNYKSHDEALLKDILLEQRRLFTKYNASRPDEYSLFGQLVTTCKAVFDSWNSSKAVDYRISQNIPDADGTACIFQQMVFGNKPYDVKGISCSGVVFTSDPLTGQKNLTGEYLIGGQGEDVVDGTVPTGKFSKENMPKWLYEFLSKCAPLANTLGYPQDIEFCFEDGKAYFLQTRDMKFSDDVLRNNLVSIFTAKSKKDYAHIDTNLLRKVTPGLLLNERLYRSITLPDERLFGGTVACSGAVTGQLVTSKEDRTKYKNPILFTDDMKIDNLVGYSGLVSLTGGVTCHAAILARILGLPTIVEPKGLSVTDTNFQVGHSSPLTIGDYVTLSNGVAYRGKAVYKFDKPAHKKMVALLTKIYRTYDVIQKYSSFDDVICAETICIDPLLFMPFTEESVKETLTKLVKLTKNVKVYIGDFSSVVLPKRTKLNEAVVTKIKLFEPVPRSKSVLTVEELLIALPDFFLKSE